MDEEKYNNLKCDIRELEKIIKNNDFSSIYDSRVMGMKSNTSK